MNGCGSRLFFDCKIVMWFICKNLISLVTHNAPNVGDGFVHHAYGSGPGHEWKGLYIFYFHIIVVESLQTFDFGLGQ